ncbi:LacI family DNA-binding transcriptional regulator [Paenibacillus marinisediminis]
MTVTKKDIADYLGISRTSVSLVLNNTPSSTVSEETRDLILKAAKELGYRDETVLPKILYILYNRECDDPLYVSDIKNIERASSNYEYGLIFMHIRSKINDFMKVQNFLGKKEAAGVILIGSVDDDILYVMEQSGVPYVVYGSVKQKNINIIEPDVVKISYECTKHLIMLGHKQIALLSGSLETSVHQKTLMGYQQALEEYDIPFNKELVQVSQNEDGYELCTRMEILEIPYTAAFSVNTAIQFGALQRLKDRGISVPNEISLIGWGLTELVRRSTPKLTTYYIDATEAVTVVDRLHDMICHKNAEPKTIYLTNVKFFEGETVSFCRKSQ